jgi:hypothetical protein
MTARTAPAKVQLAVAFAALLLMTALVIRASSAAFSGEVRNEGNAFETGSLALDTDIATAMFDVENMVPGQTETRCVNVTYEGSIADPSGVKLYSAGYDDSGTLGSWLNITIEEGSGATNTACAGFTASGTIRSAVTLAAFDTGHTDYSNGVGSWDPSGTPETISYRFVVTLASNTPPEQEGASVTGFGLTWEVQAGS